MKIVLLLFVNIHLKKVMIYDVYGRSQWCCVLNIEGFTKEFTSKGDSKKEC